VSGAATPAADPNTIAQQQQIKIEQPFKKYRTLKFIE
jgi:hypothetical protein